MEDLKPIIEQSFIQYAGAVLQSRALVDVRDCLKPSARQIFYCMHTDNFTYNKPFKKTLKAIGSAMRVYIHGDSSCEGVIMRAGQPFAMRYPLIEVEGSYGNLMESGNHAAPRYTSSRLSKIASYLFSDIKKDTINEWRDNYDDTEQYPVVLTGKGFYNIVNGSFGIGIGMGSSIPAFNLKEVNEALIKLLWNSEIDFDEIYCAPDFATGAMLLNANEVKESLRNGNGKACKLRSVVEFEPKERVLVVKEIPYGVYTNTICGELEEILNSDENPGIDRFNDLTAATPNIKIYLSKNANVDRVLKYLYKNTSLQYYYGINLTMLDNGRFPRVFTWREALQAHLDHEKDIYTRGFQFDLHKINERLHIIAALLKAYDLIDEVINTIKTSASAQVANKELQKLLDIDNTQAQAILNLKLSRLSKLDVSKLLTEQKDLQTDKLRIENILSNEDLLKKEIENGLQKVIDLFGDTRRTQILQLAESDDNEPLEEKNLVLNFTSEGGVYVSETSSLYSQKRNGVGNKFKLAKGEYVVDTIIGKNTDTVLFFSSKGNFYHKKMGDFVIGEKQFLNNLLPLSTREIIKSAIVLKKTNEKQHIIFLTKNGILKKSLLEDYNLKRNTGATAIKLDKDDEIVSVLFTDNDDIGVLTDKGNFVIIETKQVRPIGRVARGVVGVKLNELDYVTSAKIMPKTTKKILFITENGCGKQVERKEFNVTSRGTKGVKIQKDLAMCDFLPVESEQKVLITSTTSQIQLKLVEIPVLSRGAKGLSLMKLDTKAKIKKLSKIEI